MEADSERVLGTLYRSIRPRATRSEDLSEGSRRWKEIKVQHRRRLRAMLSARLRMSGEGAHAILEETGERREKRRREYPTTDDII